MTIEWGGIGLQSAMTCQVLDNTTAPATILDANEPFRVRVAWSVPGSLAPFLGGQFRLRLFAESIGPGDERLIGERFVPVVPGLANYPAIELEVAGDTLPGEGAGAPAVSGVYRVIAVLQHLNGVATEGSGFHEGQLIQLRQP